MEEITNLSRPLWQDCQIDGVPVLAPDGDWDISAEDLDSEESGRDEGGYLHRLRLREGVRTWSFSYSYLNPQDYRYMEALFGGKPEFTFRYPGPEGQISECRAYRSKHSITLRNARTGLYQNYKFNIIQC